MTTVENSLIERWPKLRGRIPFVSLGTWPTQVDQIEGPGGGASSPIWVKREDLSSRRFGGNKVRKLEFLLVGEPRLVITFGGYGSHHVLATAIHANDRGHACVGVLVPQSMTAHHTAVHGRLIEHCTSVLHIDRPIDTSKELFRFAMEAVGNLSGTGGLIVIPPGASSARGTLGYVAAGLELAAQVRIGACPEPRRIYVALGTGGTAAGLALGLALAGLDSEVVAVRVASRATGNRKFLFALARRSLNLLRKAGLDVDMPRLKVTVDNRFIGPGYARVTKEACDAIWHGKSLGLDLETTYTGKAFAALIADRQIVPKAGPEMFIHTLGSIEHLRRDATCSEERDR